jgi:hypothetical protein
MTDESGTAKIDLVADSVLLNSQAGATGQVPTVQADGTLDWETPSSGGGGVNTFQPNIQTSNYTAQVTDTITVVYMKSVNPLDFTIPENTFPVGSFITVVQDSTGTVTLVPDGATTFLPAPNSRELVYGVPVVLHQKELNIWSVWRGDGGSYTIIPVAINTGVLTLDMASAQIRNFDLTTTVSTTFAIAFDNEDAFVQSQLTLRVTGAVAISMPTGVLMMRSETNAGRWVQGSPGVLTLTGITASPMRLIFTVDASGNILCDASDIYE